jgi:hypothetical protein
MFVETRYEDILDLTGSYGLVTRLQIVTAAPRRGTTTAGGRYLAPVRHYHPADFSGGPFTISRVQHGFLAR